MKKYKKEFWFDLIEIIFRISFVTFGFLFVIEYVFPGFVTNWFNPIWLLIIAIFSGIITSLINND